MWQVWRKGEVCRFWWGNLMESDHWGDQDVDGMLILNGSSGSGKGLWGLDGVGSGYGQVGGAFEYGNELSGSIKCGEFLD